MQVSDFKQNLSWGLVCDIIFTLTLNKQCNGTALLPLSFLNLHQANATTRYYFTH